jgi:hypothetical protein
MISTDNSWHPTIKQAKFLALPFSVLEAFYAGAVYAGKSDVLLLYPIIHRFHEDARFKGVYLRRTFPELKNEIIPRSKRFYNALGGKYNQSDKVWTFPSGAMIFFGHCENEDDVHQYDSMQINYAAFDELTSFTEWQYLYITLQRVRTIKGSNLPAIVRSASNPGNIGHNWVRKRFIDPYPEGGKLIESKSGIKRIYIPATIDDNPHADPNYRKSLESLPEAEKQAKLYGKWDAYEGQVFEEFRDKRYPDEPDNALHVIDEFDIPAWWPKIVSMDWGFAPPAMTYVGYAAISPTGRLYHYREQAWQKTKIEDWAGYVREYIDVENPRDIVMCKSAGQDRGQEHTILQQVSQALGRNIQLSRNSDGSRVAGKMLIHEYLRWKPKYVPSFENAPYNQEHADWLFRNRTFNEYKSYIGSFKPQVEERNLPKIQIFKECKLLINAIKSCAYDKTHPQDVAEFPGDDPYDAFRYEVDLADRYFADASDEFTKIQERENLSAQLVETQDMTAFYRNARKLEEKEFIKPVRKFHAH